MPHQGRLTNGQRAPRRLRTGLFGAVALLAATGCGGSGSRDGGENGSASPSEPRVVELPPLPPPESLPCGGGPGLLALDATDGTRSWARCVTGGIEVLGTDGTTVLAAEFAGPTGAGGPTGPPGLRLVGLDASTGALRWSTDVAAFNESYERDAFYADGNRVGSETVVFSVPADGGGADFSHVGIDVMTGEERWRAPASQTFVTGHGDRVAVAAQPGALFETPPDAPQPDLMVIGFDRRSGAERWRRDSGIRELGAPWGPTTAVGAGLLVFPQYEPHAADVAPSRVRAETVAIDLATGAEAWRREQGPTLLLTNARGVVAGIRLIGERAGAAVRGELVALDLETGRQLWERSVGVLARPVLVADADATVVVFGGRAADPGQSASPGPDGDAPPPAHVSAFDARTGALRWSVPQGAWPAGATSRLVLVERPGQVVAVDGASGGVVWSSGFGHPEHFTTQVQADATRVYVSASSGIG